jgi:hypothetical protein
MIKQLFFFLLLPFIDARVVPNPNSGSGLSSTVSNGSTLTYFVLLPVTGVLLIAYAAYLIYRCYHPQRETQGV